MLILCHIIGDDLQFNGWAEIGACPPILFIRLSIAAQRILLYRQCRSSSSVRRGENNNTTRLLTSGGYGPFSLYFFFVCVFSTNLVVSLFSLYGDEEVFFVAATAPRYFSSRSLAPLSKHGWHDSPT